MPDKKRDWSVNREAVRALVAVYGPREAARQAKLPYGTVAKWCRVFKWKKAGRLIHTSGINGDLPVEDTATVLIRALQQHKEASTLHLAEFTAKAAKAASESKHPLKVARNVRDVASVYNTVWPQEKASGLIEEAILIGTMAVKDNPKEMLAKAEVLPDESDSKTT